LEPPRPPYLAEHLSAHPKRRLAEGTSGEVSVVKAELVPVERIQQMVLFVRGQRVMIDADLAILYGVATRVLNQAGKTERGAVSHRLHVSTHAGREGRGDHSL
jgi:hypothetical protein